MEIETHPQSAVPKSVESVLRPGVMISNAWPQSRATAGATADAIAQVLETHPFFQCYQTVDVPTADERRAIRGLLHDHGHPLTYTLTRVLGERNLNLSSLDRSNREAACAATIEQMEAAQEIGATTLCVISGPRPEAAGRREAALAALEESLATICAAARTKAPDMEVLIEPLDYEAHKRNTLGSTEEAVRLCQNLQRAGLELRLCLDTAHLTLNAEAVTEAVALAAEYIAEFHFCNCCTDRSNPLFGDRHLPFGPPGVVDFALIGTWMGALFRQQFFHPDRRPRVFCEVWKPDDMDSLEIVSHCEAALKQGWRHALAARP